MNSGARANARRSATDNGTLYHNWDRWAKSACTLCTDKTVGWKHKKADHRCTQCGKKGHEGPFDGEKPNKSCKFYIARPIGDTTQVPLGETDPKEAVEHPEKPPPKDEEDQIENRSNSIIVRMDTSSPGPISTSFEEGKTVVTVNDGHPNYSEMMGKLKPFVRSWEKENESEEEE